MKKLRFRVHLLTGGCGYCTDRTYCGMGAGGVHTSLYSATNCESCRRAYRKALRAKVAEVRRMRVAIQAAELLGVC